VTESDKHSSFLRYGINYSRKKFVIEASGYEKLLGNGGGSEERKEKRKNGNSKPTGRLKNLKSDPHFL
jgi:hypothetical protein